MARLVACLVATTVTSFASDGFAEDTVAPRSATSSPTARIRVRLGMSKDAAARLSDLRVRRLLRLEVDDIADLEGIAEGTLEGDDLIRVWIDVPMPRRAVIEVRRVDGSFARRALSIDDFPSDVAAEAVALAAAEMVRVQERVVDTPPPEPQTPRPDGMGGAAWPAVLGGAALLVVPSADPVLFVGPELGLALVHGALGHHLYGRWQIGASDTAARWLEIGGGVDFRWPPRDALRLHVSLTGGFVDVALPSVASIDGRADHHAWNVRLAGTLGAEARVAPNTWLTLAVEPGAALRELDIHRPDGSTSELGGFAFGIQLGLHASPLENDHEP